MAYHWTFEKGPLKIREDPQFCEQSTIQYGIIDYGITMDLQKRSYIKPSESCPH